MEESAIKKHEREVDLSCVYICPLLNELYTYLEIFKYIGKPDHYAFSLPIAQKKLQRKKPKMAPRVLLRINFQNDGR